MSIRLDHVPVPRLGPACTQRMFELLTGYFDGVTEPDFHRDLAEKDEVMLLTDTASGDIVGFSTLTHFNLPTPAGDVTVVFSGDTAVEETSRSFWGFAYGLDAYFREVRRQAGGAPVHYVLVSKGWRTYRVLGFLFREFFPGGEGEHADALRSLARAFGERRHPDRWDERRGVLAARPGGPRIRRDGPDVLPAHRLADPLVEYFARANPGHEQGDELVGVANVDPGNYSTAFRRMVRRRAGGAG